MNRIKRLAPYMILGPISGPLAAVAVSYFRRGEMVLGSLYVFAIVEIFFLLPVVVAGLGLKLL